MLRLSTNLRFAMRHHSTSAAGAEYAFPPYPVSWLKRDTLLFAASIGCKVPSEHHFLYELHPQFAVFPTYPSVLPFKRDSQDVVDYLASQQNNAIPGVPNFDSRKALDGQRLLQVFSPLPTTSKGQNFEIRSKILGVYDKGKPGSVVETEQLLVNTETNAVYTRMVSSKFFVGQGGWGGPAGPATPKYPPPEGQEDAPDKVSEIQLSNEVAHLYRLNGDYNPLHATPEPGLKIGLGGTIVHGLYTWNASAVIVLRAFGGSDPVNMKEFQARFAAPVKPGVKLAVKMWKLGEVEDGFSEVRFVAEANGEVVLSNGRALIRCDGETGEE